MDDIRKSFKSQNSYKHLRNISAGGAEEVTRNERQPILMKSEPDSPMEQQRREVIVKIDDRGSREGGNNGGGGTLWRGSSYDFWKEGENAGVGNNGGMVGGGGGGSEGGNESFEFQNRVPKMGDGGVDDDDDHHDPPSKLIGQFLQKQMTSGGEMSLDMDMDMDLDEFSGSRVLSQVAESPDNRTVTFHQPFTAEIAAQESRRRYRDLLEEDEDYSNHRRRSLNPHGDGDDEVVTCTSNASFQRKPTLSRAKTRSRLLDPPEQPDRGSGRTPKSTQLKSGLMGKSMDTAAATDDDDPFFDDDLPDDFKRGNFNAWTILQWVSLILIIAALICSLTVPSFKGRILWELQLWKWEVMVLVLICGRLVSGWGIRLAVFFIELNFLLRKKVLYFVYGVRKAVQNCLWLGLVLLAWHYLFDKKIERETNSKVLIYVTKVLICLLVSTIVWLVKTLVVKVLASSFHVSTYFDRIQESLFNQYVIESLSGPPLVEMQNAHEEEEKIKAEVCRLQNAGATISPELKAAAFLAKSGKMVGSGCLQKSPLGKSSKHLLGAVSKKMDDNKITIEHLHKLNNKNVSAWNMKRLMNIVRHGALSTLDEQMLDSYEGTTEIRSELEAKAAARKIFQNVAKPGKKFITFNDVLRFLREDEALKALSLFEGATETRKISKSALKNWVVNAFRERRALALTLNDTKTAVKKLHNVLDIVVVVILLIVWLIILQIASTKILLLISSQLLLVAFIFGNTLKTIFEAIIFLFVMHPFDVGDRCEIDEVQMIVEEMNILNTVFLRYDNLRIIYPNSVLATKAISNYYRSPDMGDAVNLSLHIATPIEKIALMKQRITSHIENNKEHWYPAPIIVLKDVEDLNILTMAVWPNHRINHQDIGERWARRGQLVEEIVRIIKELDIQYRLYPLDINIRSMPSLTQVPSECDE